MFKKKIIKAQLIILILSCAWFYAEARSTIIAIAETQKDKGEAKGTVYVKKKVVRTYVRGGKELKKEKWESVKSGSLRAGQVELSVPPGEYKVKLACSGTYRETNLFSISEGASKTFRFNVSTIEIIVEKSDTSNDSGKVWLIREATPEEAARTKDQWYACHHILVVRKGQEKYSLNVVPGKYKVKLKLNQSEKVSNLFRLHGKDFKSLRFPTGSVTVDSHQKIVNLKGQMMIMQKGKKWEIFGYPNWYNREPRTFSLVPGVYKLGLKINNIVEEAREFAVRENHSQTVYVDPGIVTMTVEQDKGYVSGKVTLYRQLVGQGVGTGKGKWINLRSSRLNKSVFKRSLPPGSYKIVLECSRLKKEIPFTLGWKDSKNYRVVVGNIRIVFDTYEKEALRLRLEFSKKTRTGEWKHFFTSSGCVSRMRGRSECKFPVFPGEYKVELKKRSELLGSQVVSVSEKEVKDVKF